MWSRRNFILTSLSGAAVTSACPAMASFEPPPHRHIPKIEARLRIWRDHAMEQRDILLSSTEPHIAAWRTASAGIPNAPETVLFDGVNKLINSEIVYKPDYVIHQTSDF